MSELGVYSPEEVTVTIAGIYTITGLAEDSFIGLVKNNPIYTHKTSSDGVVSRNKVADNSYTLTLSLLQASESNSVLTMLLAIDRLSGKAKFPVLIKDNTGTSLFGSATAWIFSTPNLDYSTTGVNRTWQIYCTENTIFVGNNFDTSSDLEDTLTLLAGVTGGVLGEIL